MAAEPGAPLCSNAASMDARDWLLHASAITPSKEGHGAAPEEASAPSPLAAIAPIPRIRQRRPRSRGESCASSSLIEAKRWAGSADSPRMTARTM